MVGPGLADEDRLAEAVSTALGSGRPVVLDAEALTKIAPGPVIITPHTGEFARLGYQPGADPIAAVRASRRGTQGRGPAQGCGDDRGCPQW